MASGGGGGSSTQPPGGDKGKQKKKDPIRVSVGRTGRQARLKELMNDDKLGSADRGWLKQDANAMRKDRTQRPTLRVPPGKQLAHKRGFEASKGYGYDRSNLQLKSIHDTQHKYDKMGYLNKDMGKK
jgi:hypothetical protein